MAALELEDRQLRSEPAGYAASGLAGVGDHFFVPYGSGPFPPQGSATAFNCIGNVTRYNPKVRMFPNLNENMSITRSLPDHGSLSSNSARKRSTSSTASGSGRDRPAAEPDVRRPDEDRGARSTRPRQMQLALKLLLLSVYLSRTGLAVEACALCYPFRFNYKQRLSKQLW